MKTRSLRILILDDDDLRHRLWGDLFRKAGHNVIHATSIDAFTGALYSGQKIDLVFLDHDLNDWQYDNRGHTGQHACHILCELPHHLRPKRIVIHSWNVMGAHLMHKILYYGNYNPRIKRFSEILYFRADDHQQATDPVGWFRRHHTKPQYAIGPRTNDLDEEVIAAFMEEEADESGEAAWMEDKKAALAGLNEDEQEDALFVRHGK